MFKLIELYFEKEINMIIKQGVKINIIGKINQLPLKVKKILKETKFKTKKNNKLIVNFAINYCSHNEIIETIKKIKKNSNQINKKNIERNLSIKYPFPDILIRTGGRKRLSNFLLWQMAYT